MLIGIPYSINPEFLFALARMGHGDTIVIADANFPSDSVASHCVVKTPIRVHGTTSDILRDVLKLLPLDQYTDRAVAVMDKVQSDKDKDLYVPAYKNILDVVNSCETVVTFEDPPPAEDAMDFVERMEFYDRAKKCFAVVQTDDTSLYANIIITKGVVPPFQ